MDDHPALLNAITAGSVEDVRRFVSADPGLANARDGEGVSALRLAVYRGRRDIADILLAAGAQQDVFDAAALGDAAYIAALLDAAPRQIAARSSDGWTALHLAAFFGHPETVTTLLQRGADVTAWSTNGMTNQPLHAAAASQNVEVCRLLIDAGAPLDTKQHGGFTPLHEAAVSGNAPLAALLLEHGADQSLLTEDGKSAADLAREHGHAEVAALLGA